MSASILRTIFPYLERLFRFLRTDIRQEYLLGILSSDTNACIIHLQSIGFENQIFAWVDDGQVASLRKREGDFQYHIRIFNDGEVRGHYEYAPEVAPIKHLRRIAREARSPAFRTFVEGYVQAREEALNHATLSSVRQVALAPSYRT